MTVDFIDLPARAGSLFAKAERIRDVASAALDAIGERADGDKGSISRRFVAPGPVPWEAPQLAVFPGRFHVGQAGGEEFAPLMFGAGAWAIHTVPFLVQVVISGSPVNSAPRAALSTDGYEAVAERLYRCVWAIFIGLIQAQQTDQLEGLASVVVGPAEPPQQPQAGLVGYTLAVSTEV